MATCYAMGTYNDNFFKQAALLLAASAKFYQIQGVAMVLFALPFVVFAAWAGWLADRLPKTRIVIWSKLGELIAMTIGLVALVHLSWNWILVVIFIMALQSTFFSPALNGSIPEMFSSSQVPRVNAIMKLATTVTILMGIALGGILLDVSVALPEKWMPVGDYASGRVIVGCAAMLVAMIGILAALGIGRGQPGAMSTAPFPWLGPIDSARQTLECRKKDPSLFLALMAEAFFYSISSFALLCINNLGVQQIGMTVTFTSLLSVSLAFGICVGAIFAGRYEAVFWKRLILPSGIGMCVGLMVSALVVFFPAHGAFVKVYLLTVFLLTGLFAGVYLIPVVSFIQIRPPAAEKGKVLGISSFASFAGIIVAGIFFSKLDWVNELTGGIQPSTILAVSGAFGLVFMLWVALRLRAFLPFGYFRPLGILLRVLLSLRYRVTTSGLETLTSERPTLFLPNHPGLIDPFLIYSQIAGYAPRPLADDRQMGGFLGKVAAMFLHAVRIPDISKVGAQAVTATQRGIRAILDALRSGDSVLMYPSGRIYRSSRESIGGNSAAWSLIQQALDIQVVLVRTHGLWGSDFGFGATGKAPVFNRMLIKSILVLLGNFIVLMPRRKVHMEFVAMPDLASISDRIELNRFLEDFYNEAEAPPVKIPHWFWKGAKPVPLPEYNTHINVSDTKDVSQDVREEVSRILRQTASLPDDHPVYDSMSLRNDLGLDSLTMMQVSVEIEAVFHRTIPSLERLNTVADCLLAAIGQLDSDEEFLPAPPAWFAPPTASPLELPTDMGNIVTAFMRHLKHNPKDPLLADRGVLRNRRQIFMGALIIRERLLAMPGSRIGIMLPSVPAVVVVWLAALLAGKTPVFINWTTGLANLRHVIGLVEVDRIVSATELMSRLELQGVSLNELPAEFIALDEMAKSFTVFEKARGVIRSRLWRDTSRFQVPETAAVLFTSGSESLPKAVPLSHQNLLTNATDVIKVLNLDSEDTVLAMLPPFHSFGLIVGIVIPLATGFKAVFHANPTESAQLNALIRDFRISLLATPPTFLQAMLEQARGTEQLASVKYAFVGAEKCSEHVYEAFSKQCPSASLCEGYGITECSPAVSVNRPGDVRPGTIGPFLPSVRGVIVREEGGIIHGRAATGETGMLLLKGASIFSGYLGDSPSPFVTFEDKTWYRTGDLVSMDEEGRLTFRGRLKRFVKVGGEMISLPQLEETLLEAYARHESAPEEGIALAVEATPDENNQQIVLFTPMELTLAEVNTTIRSAGLSPLFSVRQIHRIDSIPLLGSGKTDYRALKELMSGV